LKGLRAGSDPPAEEGSFSLTPLPALAGVKGGNVALVGLYTVLGDGRGDSELLGPERVLYLSGKMADMGDNALGL